MEDEKLNDMLNDILDKLREFARNHGLRLWVEVTNEESHYFMFNRYSMNNKCCEYMIVPEEVESVDDIVKAITEDVIENLLVRTEPEYSM